MSTEAPTRILEFINDGCLPAVAGQRVLDAAIEAGIPIFHVCGGNGRCSTCRVLVLE
ncbi:MAG: 2Fe-2S iron-sulfur cluster binding domain-containing protein, partial [Sphingobacteriales bacterium]